jgi:hypothetical protein
MTFDQFDDPPTIGRAPLGDASVASALKVQVPTSQL